MLASSLKCFLIILAQLNGLSFFLILSAYYAGSMTAPSAVGTYAITFDVAAAQGWNVASGLSAGTLTITNAITSEKPVINNVTISKAASGADTIITLTIDASSNVPLQYAFYFYKYPTIEVGYGTTKSGFTETSSGHWRLVTTDTVSQYTPSGDIIYHDVKVSTAGGVNSDAWAGELKIAIP
jgi:hypothetical protein